MNTRQRLATAMLLAMGVAGPAHADLSGAVPFTFSNGFVYTGSLPVGGVLSASLFETTPGIDITSVTLTKASDPSFNVSWSGLALPNGTEIWSMGATNVTAGNYTLTILGSGDAEGVGQYYLKTDAVVNAIPEPASAVLLLCGLAGAALWRRRVPR